MEGHTEEKGSTMTESFHDWFFEQADRPDEVGALARSVKSDPFFPEHGGKAIFEGYFEGVSEPASAKKTFELAWEEFTAKPIAP